MPQIASLSAVLAEATRQEASDVLFTFGCAPALKKPGEKMVVLDKYASLNDKNLESLVKEVVRGDRLKSLETDRQVDLAIAVNGNRFRVNVFYQRGHLSIAMRLVRSQIRSLEELELPRITQELLANDNGMILLVGPTGCGKSTSLAAMVQHINENYEKHIITIEDPIEYVYENKRSIIEQREVGIDAVTFASALRSALREAPDVILLGEMRDLESIATAITLAETGHLVLSTIHASNAAGTIDRIIDIFPAEAKEQVRVQLSDILLGVFNQRLVPLAEEKRNRAFVEVMLNDSAVRNIIRSGNTSQLRSVIQTSAADGMHLLDDLLVEAADRGEITKESALSFADDRAAVRKSLSPS